MATKADFTDEEWTTLSETPAGLVLWISSIDPGFLARAKESWAAGQAVVKGASTELQHELAKPSMPDLGADLTKLREAVLSALRGSLATLEAKAPAEVEPFKVWIDSICLAVADAAGGTTPEEAEALAAVREALSGNPPGDGPEPGSEPAAPSEDR
jgi:hypothetical protein